VWPAHNNLFRSKNAGSATPSYNADLLITPKFTHPLGYVGPNISLRMFLKMSIILMTFWERDPVSLPHRTMLCMYVLYYSTPTLQLVS
jgi:hypothetical protein